MARKPEFDRDACIDRATHLFWQKGYTATSMRDLLDAMKIGRGSFYNSLRSKRRVYLECLKHYNATVTRRRIATLQAAPTAREGIRAFFKSTLDELDDPKTPQVCLLAGSVSADVLSDAELRKYVVKEITAFAAHFSDRLAEARRTGEISRAIDPVVTANLLVTYLQGLYRVARELQDRRELERQVETLLGALGI